MSNRLEYQRLYFFSEGKRKNQIAGISYDKIDLFDAKNRRIIETMDCRDLSIKNIRYNPSCDWVIFVGTNYLEKRDIQDFSIIATIGMKPIDRDFVNKNLDEIPSISNRPWHDSVIESASISPDGKRILTCCSSYIKEWDSTTGELIQTLSVKVPGIKQAIYSPNGERLMTLSEDGTLKEWSTSTGICIQALKVGLGKPIFADYHPSKAEIVSYSTNLQKSLLERWNLKTGICTEKYDAKYWMYSLKYHPDGDRLLFYHGNSKLLTELSDNDLEKITREFPNAYNTEDVRCVDYSKDGKWVVVSKIKKSIIQIWSAITNTQFCFFSLSGLLWEKDEGVDFVSFSTDGKKIIFCSYKRNRVCVLDINLPAHHENFTPIEFKIMFVNKLQKTQMVMNRIVELEVEFKMKFAFMIEPLRKSGDYFYRPDYAIFNDKQTKMLIRENEGNDKKLTLLSAEPPYQTLSELKCSDPCIDPSFSPNDQKIAFTPRRTELCEASTSTFEIIQKYPDQVGLFVQSCDFSNRHSASVFTEEEQDVLRRYGAIFDEQDEAHWVWALVH